MKKETKINEKLMVERKRSSARLRRGILWDKTLKSNFEEYLSENSQFRKTLRIILTIFRGGSFTQDFEELQFS